MSDIFKQKHAETATAIIGKGMTIKGTFRSSQDVFLDGEIEGELDVENCTLTIGPNGKALANARAREVHIHGTITGNVESTERISIRTGGRLVGDVRTAGIVIEEGAYFKGGVDIVNTRAQAKAAGEA